MLYPASRLDRLPIQDIIKISSSRRNRMLSEYIQKALEKAHDKVLEDGKWVAEMPCFGGIWTKGNPVEECRHELEEVLKELDARETYLRNIIESGVLGQMEVAAKILTYYSKKRAKTGDITSLSISQQRS